MLLVCCSQKTTNLTCTKTHNDCPTRHDVMSFIFLKQSPTAAMVCGPASYGLCTRPPRRRIGCTTGASARAQETIHQVERAKNNFYQRIKGTERGARTSSIERGAIEEALVQLENVVASESIDWSHLPGTWNVVYTTARDVRDIVKEQPVIPFARSTLVGQEYSSIEEGEVTNIIRLELVDLPPFLDILSGTHISILVKADYAISSLKSIGLRFKSAAVGHVEPSDGIEGLILNPVLPRGQWNLTLLNFLRDLEIAFQFPEGSPSNRIRPSLDITFLDSNLFVGRAQQGGGVYVYERVFE